MKKTLTAIAITLCSVACSAAPPSDDSIRTLFKVMKAESLLESIYADIEPSMRQAMAKAYAGKTLNEKQKAVIDRAPQRMSKVLRDELSWEKMEPMQLSIYRESFEQSDIDALIAFYKSPVGQSYINKMPIVTQKAMSAVQVHLQQVMPRLKATMEEILAEAKLTPPK